MNNKKKIRNMCAAAMAASVVLTGNGVCAEEQNIEESVVVNSITAEEESVAEDFETEEINEELTTESEQEEEIIVTEEETEVETEQELVLEPEYNSEQDPNPLVNQVQKSLEKSEREQIHHIELPDSEWIAINGEKATCTSFARLQYGYAPEVQQGTIRYISQLTGSGLFDWSYWGGWGNQAETECGTASISMALSYIGVNLTPQEILDAHGGLTVFSGWGVTDLSPDVAGGVEQYINGRGQYSPVIVHLPTYSQLGHYVVLIGKVSDTEYLVLDCAQDTTWVMSVYSDFYNSIDQVYQYYNSEAPMLDHTPVTDKPVLATCTKMGWTAGTHCQICDEVITEQQAVPCNGHAWSDWVTKTEPTTQQEGEKIRICRVCGQTDSRSVEALPAELILEIPAF